MIGLAVLVGLALYHRQNHRYDRTIRQAALRYGVDPALVKAVIWRESGFKASARGKAGEIGLMQIRELAAIEWSAAERVRGFEMNQLLDPETNALAGTWYLAQLLQRYRDADDPVPYALADFNAGRSNVRRWLKEHPEAATNAVAFVGAIGFPMTRRYVESIQRRQERYRRDFPLLSLSLGR